MIGAMRQRVTLQSLSLVADGAGGNLTGWTDTATLFANITPLTGAAKVQAEQRVSEVTHRVLVRAGLAVSAGQRLVWRGTTLNIQAVFNLAARDKILVLLCVEAAAT
jgi:SPP1 family predicted phage head-tail adaptor